MEKVLGIGGLFFRSKDPTGLAAWYRDHLGIDLVPETYEEQPWQQQAGSTVFSPFQQTTDYFRDPDKQWMINFRVANLDVMVVQLSDAGIDVELDSESQPNGRFARLTDPEGNPIELWEELKVG